MTTQLRAITFAHVNTLPPPKELACDGTEEWRPVPGWPRYFVSSLGRVCSTKGKGGAQRILSQYLEEGYRVVRVRDHGRTAHLSVHRALLMAFDRMPAPDEETRHLDGNRLNNSLGNLRWGTRKENIEDRYRHGAANTGDNNPNAKLTRADVAYIRATANTRRPTEIARELGVSYHTVHYIRKGRGWSRVR